MTTTTTDRNDIIDTLVEMGMTQDEAENTQAAAERIAAERCQQTLYNGTVCRKPATRHGFNTRGDAIGRCTFHAKSGYGFLTEPQERFDLSVLLGTNRGNDGNEPPSPTIKR